MQDFSGLTEISSKKRINKIWKRVVVILSCFVVFCTTYMLILPALTMERDAYCGFQEHEHGVGCYEIISNLICGYEVEEAVSEEVSSAPTPSATDELSTEEATQESTTAEESSTEESSTEEPASEEASSEETGTTEESLSEATSLPSQTESHVHTDACYETELKQICVQTEHTHSELCFVNPESVTENESQESGAADSENGSEGNSINLFAESQSGVTRINFDDLDKTGETAYVVFTVYNNNYYALDGNGNAVPVTVGADGTVTSSSMGTNLYWTFSLQSGTSYLIRNSGTSRYMHSYYNSSSNYGVTTKDPYSSSLETTGSGSSKTFSVKSNSNYSVIGTSGGNVVFSATQSNDANGSSKAADFYLAEVFVPQDVYHVWFDGTCGGLMSLYQADNTYLAVPGTDNTIILPSSWKSPSKYDYKLNGWYDIKNHTYYKPGQAAVITKNTVFYADWVAATYDVGQNNSHVVSSLDTNSFIRTDMFDYSAVFNFQAVTHSGSVSASGHDETWSIVQNDTVPYMNKQSLGFIFRDWDNGNKHISYASNRARLNDNQGTEITSEIIDYVYDMSGENIIDLLFNPETKVIGKTHVGEANFLYQFMEEGSPNYDNIHNGYYYYDATLNAASYNQTEERFYIYDYLERTSDSLKDSFDSNGNPTAGGAYSDFLPFNSPYVNNSNNKTIVDYADKNGNYGNYQYDAKATNQGSAAANAGTNYWFGMKSEIQFYLPNDTGEVDAYGNYGNISTHGEHMNFQFHGDDDLWVFIDGELVMDVGGLHGIMNGNIDFSTGIITTDTARNNSLEATPTQTTLDLEEGDHTLTIYYMERGGSQSNCAIYFNIAPRYGVEITKQDLISSDILNGAEFSVFTDKECTIPAELWLTEADYRNNERGQNVFTGTNGTAYFWGLSAGKVYYIRETKAPAGYPETDDIVRVALNNLGGSVCTTDSLRGENEEHTDGFDVLESDADESIHLLRIVLTNLKEVTDEEGTTNLRVRKNWATGTENLPESITVYLLADGKIAGKSVILNDDNDWTYTWTGLPLKDGDRDIVYSVREVQVPGFTTKQSEPESFSDMSEWSKSNAFRDGDTFLIVNKDTGMALSVRNGAFAWVNRETAESSTSSQWTAIADGMGFRVQNGDGYNITLDGTARFTPANSGNRVVYFYNSRLFAQNGNTYYYFSSDWQADSSDGAQLELYRKTSESFSGDIVTVTNTPIPEDEQTKLTVDKVWEDGADAHSDDEVTVRLFSDGKDTGRTAVLNRDNGWSATFDGLLYKKDGVPVSYTVEEDYFDSYSPQYSQIMEIPGEERTEWETTTLLEDGEIYRFTSGNYALASNRNNAVVSATNNPDDVYQQWQVVSYNGKLKLKNLGNNRYLYYNSSFSMNNSNSSNYTDVVLSVNVLRIGNNLRYVTLSSSRASTTTSSNSATRFAVTKKALVTTNPRYKITVNNIKAHYVLPATGGVGEYTYAVCGMLVILAAFAAVLLTDRRKKKLR